jgi:hypothetical protein
VVTGADSEAEEGEEDSEEDEGLIDEHRLNTIKVEDNDDRDQDEEDDEDASPLFQSDPRRDIEGTAVMNSPAAAHHAPILRLLTGKSRTDAFITVATILQPHPRPLQQLPTNKKQRCNKMCSVDSPPGCGSDELVSRPLSCLANNWEQTTVMVGTRGSSPKGRKRAIHGHATGPAHQEQYCTVAGSSQQQQHLIQPPQHVSSGLFDPEARGVAGLFATAAAMAAGSGTGLGLAPHNGEARDISSSPPLFCGGNNVEGARPMPMTSPILHTRVGHAQ